MANNNVRNRKTDGNAPARVGVEIRSFTEVRSRHYGRFAKGTDVRNRKPARIHRGQGNPQGCEPDDQQGRYSRADGSEWFGQEPVSYTHLTLPTILRV